MRLVRLDPGERQAIHLARREHADLLLMDEILGVRIAREEGLAVTGTLGVLLQAARRGLIDLETTLADLQSTDFRCSRRVIEEVRRRATMSS
jgi:predicted nucleic acid-binding protein